MTDAQLLVISRAVGRRAQKIMRPDAVIELSALELEALQRWPLFPQGIGSRPEWAPLPTGPMR